MRDVVRAGEYAKATAAAGGVPYLGEVESAPGVAGRYPGVPLEGGAGGAGGTGGAGGRGGAGTEPCCSSEPGWVLSLMGRV